MSLFGVVVFMSFVVLGKNLPPSLFKYTQQSVLAGREECSPFVKVKCGCGKPGAG